MTSTNTNQAQLVDRQLVDRANSVNTGSATFTSSRDDVRGADVLVQLRSNLSQLDELHARLRFVMAEVSYLLKKD